MKSKTNIEVRKAMKAAGMKYADLEAITGKSQPTLYRMLQNELSEEDKNSMMELIRIYAGGGDSEKMKDITLNALEELNEDTNEETAATVATIAENYATANGAKSEAELLAMMDAIRKTERTPAEEEERAKIIAQMSKLNEKSAQEYKELQTLRNQYGGYAVLPAKVADRIRQIKANREVYKHKIECLKLEWKQISDAEITWAFHMQEQYEKETKKDDEVTAIEKAMKSAQESGNYDEYKKLEEKAFKAKAEMQAISEEIIRELNHKPDTRPAIRKTYAEFQKENRRAMLLRLKALSDEMKRIVNESRNREIEMQEYADNFIEAPFQKKQLFDSVSFIQSYYQGFSGVGINEAFFQQEIGMYK